MKSVTAIAVVACCLASVAGAADWPVWLGPTGNGIAPDTGINKDWNARPPQELWRVPLSDQGFAGPSVAEGRVFIVDHQGDQDLVRALALGTGAEIWRFAYADLAEFDHGFSRATPVFVEGNLYTISYLGKVHCLNAATGEKVWMRDMPSEFGGTRPQWGYAMSAFIDGEKLIICPGGANASVAALNRLTGETIWTGGGSDIPGYATPAKVTLNGEEQYLVFAGTSFLGVAADDGELLWQVPWVNQWKVNAATPFAIGERVIFTSGYGAGCAAIEIGAQGVETKWKHTEVCARFTTPIYYNDWIFANSESGSML